MTEDFIQEHCEMLFLAVSLSLLLSLCFQVFLKQSELSSATSHPSPLPVKKTSEVTA